MSLMTRAMTWGGLHNVWDLGGLPAAEADTVRGRVFRSPRLDDLDAAGWDALLASGVRTVVDLRNDDEVAPLALPAGVTVHRRPVEDQGDAAFMGEWGRRLNSPAAWRPTLEAFPDKVVAALRAVAEAPEDGAVLVHCAGGRDRTGLISAMLLQLAGTAREGIVNDYWLGVIAANFHLRDHPRPHERGRTDAELGPWLDEVTEHLEAFLDEVDAADWLRAQGAGELVAPLRRRLLTPVGHPLG